MTTYVPMVGADYSLPLLGSSSLFGFFSSFVGGFMPPF